MDKPHDRQTAHNVVSFFEPAPEVLKLTPPPDAVLGPLTQAVENKTLVLGPQVRERAREGLLGSERCLYVYIYIYIHIDTCLTLTQTPTGRIDFDGWWAGRAAPACR
jgi:hypothetical protein